MRIQILAPSAPEISRMAPDRSRKRPASGWPRPVRWALTVCFGILAFALAFRSFIWASWVPAPDEPYSFADVIEIYLFFTLLLASLGSFLLAVVMALVKRWRDPRTVMALCLIGVLAPLAHWVLFPLVPTFRFW
jgi:magnesium-transporting ATPase (P-type)